MGFGGQRSLIILIASCLAAGCASNAQLENLSVTPSRMTVGAPSALATFCQDVPAECSKEQPENRRPKATLSRNRSLAAFDNQAFENLQPSRIPTSAITDPQMPPPSANSRTATPPAFENVDLTNSSLIFQLLMAKAALKTENDYDAAPLFRIRRSEALEDNIYRVNRRINRAIIPAEDQLVYGEADKWAMPLSYRNGQLYAVGDCEDYALEKRRALIDSGIDPRALALAIVHKEEVGLHAVLILYTDEGDLVLDNLTGQLRTPAESGYEFILVQSGQYITNWSVASVIPYTPLSGEPAPEAKLAIPELASTIDFMGPPV